MSISMSAITSWLSSSWVKVAGAVLVLASLAYLGWQNDALRAERDAAREDYGQEKAVNVSLRSAAQALVEQNIKQNKALTAEAERRDYLTGRNTYLFRQLREARNANNSKDFVLDRVTVDSLCLLVLTAEGVIPGDYEFPHLGQSLEGRSDPIAKFCSTWNPLTAQGAIDWSGEVVAAFGLLKSQVRAAREAQGGK